MYHQNTLKIFSFQYVGMFAVLYRVEIQILVVKLSISLFCECPSETCELHLWILISKR